MTITSRIDAITKIDAPHRGVVIPAPRSVKMELNTRCNYSCTFCVRSVRENDCIDMDRSMYSRIIRELRDAGVEELGLFYINEPFTCSWLHEAIAEAKEVGFPYVFLTTNGANATPNKVRKCMEAGLDSLKFSVNFADEEQFGAVAKVNTKLWLKALDHIAAARKVRDEGPHKCGLYASSIAFDGEQGERMKRVVDSYVRPYVDEFYWLPLYGMSGASKANGMRPQPGNPGRLDAMRAPLPCWAVFTEGHITADGKLSACCFGNGADDALAMADLNQVSFMDGWNSLAYQQLRQAHLDGDVSKTPCAECTAG